MGNLVFAVAGRSGEAIQARIRLRRSIVNVMSGTDSSPRFQAQSVPRFQARSAWGTNWTPFLIGVKPSAPGLANRPPRAYIPPPLEIFIGKDVTHGPRYR